MKLSKLLNIFKENNTLVYIKEKLIEVLNKHKDELKPKVLEYVQEKSPKVKDLLLNDLFNKIKFGFPMCLFKGIIKKTVKKNFDKIIDFILSQIEKY